MQNSKNIGILMIKNNSTILINGNTIYYSILIIHKPSLGSCEVPQKCGPDRFSRFDVYLIQTDKQTNRHPSQIYIQMNVSLYILCNFHAGASCSLHETLQFVFDFCKVNICQYFVKILSKYCKSLKFGQIQLSSLYHTNC